jgi:hypothetical protein
MKIQFIAAVCMAIGAQAVFAVEGGGEAKQQEMFVKMKEIKLAGIRGKIEIGQQAVSCVQSAQNTDAVKACDDREKQRNEELQHRQKERWESLKPR